MATKGEHQPSLDQMTSIQMCVQNQKTNFAIVLLYIVGYILMMVLCNFMHALLKPLSQPRIVSETILGMIFGNIKGIYKGGPFEKSLPQTLKNISEFGMICYMFVLGLEMEPLVLLRGLTREAKVSYAGILSAFVLGFVTIKFFMPSFDGSRLEFILALSITLAGTASPVLTRLITNLKIGKSDIGRFVVIAGVHSDFVCTLILCIGFVLLPTRIYFTSNTNPLHMAGALLLQAMFTSKFGPLVMNWVNKENPEGKPMKGSHLVISVAFVVLTCVCSPSVMYSSILSAFISGICLPRKGRISKMMVSKVNYLLNTIFYPLLFFWVGMVADVTKFEAENGWTWEALVVIFMVTTLGKVFGTVVSGVLLGFHWPESVAIGLLLATKGHFHMFLAVVAIDKKLATTTTGIVIIIVFFLTVIYTPSVVSYIIERAKKRSPNQKMALQWLDPLNELRILQCLHGLQNVPSTISFMEISRGTADPGTVVYVTDMIELTEQVAATLVHREGVEAVTVSDKEVTEMRDQITRAVQNYLQENSEGITLRRMLALSTINNMHQDVCILAEDLMVSLIILPFHNFRRADGELEQIHPGFRYVNRKVLRHAPCSVGILVDRGLGMINRISRSCVSLNAAVIFIGGKDDREALAYASRVARHPGVSLTVIRFLLDTDTDYAQTRAGRSRASIAEQEEEMKLDDECFADFYEQQVAGGYVAYMEKHLVNSAETFSALRSLEGQYELIIVGRGGRVNSVLTVGMNDWEQCPELGPIGDILSSTHFSSTASVLVIQQHSLKGEIDGLHDEFSIM
ncbi:hypothetical protein L1049_011871 [Liquidambar formosana]|uniref:Cation/H+ exchanger domain-containing protein n=1 Tax=Liquidambar formosana TaxID=63359 RepID=A0AAP0RXA2_LIQFO